MAGTEKTLTRSIRTKSPGRKEAQSLEEHFSPESLAQRLECSVAKVRKSIWQGQLDAARVGRLVRIPASSVEHIRNRLRGYYADAIETKVLPGPNPAGDLRHFIGKQAQRKARQCATTYFAQEEAPQLVATARGLFPRWHAFILTGLLGGLRWGESAALRVSDIDFKRGRIHVERTWSSKAGRLEAPKDHEGRHVKASPALLAALQAHLEAIALEGQVQDWSAEQRALTRLPSTRSTSTSPDAACEAPRSRRTKPADRGAPAPPDRPA